ncbi:hypothetical protein K443DRAFT_120354 [Laccaria amethystina LaAM-08-1]|uniref:Uncharacterized protein n=1 Tax=Laccaria amethystina LaAM-08-1 TaxID=1095629 RepID=A0A0C9YCY5_9AGAR|nr:hypothetical protein K443DRAFT_120354 [Laccaria amethystina LaAM-08-1]
MGVGIIAFGNFDELYNIAHGHSRAKYLAFGIKFGASLFTVSGSLAKAKELGLDVVGVSFYVGNGCYDPSTPRRSYVHALPSTWPRKQAFRLAANINAPLAMPVREISDQPAGILHQRWDVWRFQPYLVRSPQPNILSMNGSFASSEPAHLSCALPATPSTLLARRPFPVALQIGDWLGGGGYFSRSPTFLLGLDEKG